MSEPQPRSQQDAGQPPLPREIPSTELFHGDRAVLITHSGERYRLMITRNDKLILQK